MRIDTQKKTNIFKKYVLMSRNWEMVQIYGALGFSAYTVVWLYSSYGNVYKISSVTLYLDQSFLSRMSYAIRLK